MDRSYGEGASTFNSIEQPQGRPSVESVGTARLQKKRSVGRVRSDVNHPLAKSQAEPPGNPRAVQGTHQRKGSLRDAVRKIFSRRSKVSEPAPPSSIQSTPSKYKSHHSQPPETVPEQNDDAPSRADSAPLRRDTTSIDIQRLRSPNAVEFPKSKNLKPLILPSPFDDPRSTLRRRKTLPSILIPPQDAKEIAAAITSAGPFPGRSNTHNVPLPSIGLAFGTSRSAKRRSRSAGDLKASLQRGSQRKRSDEIKFWRESIQTTILRASGFNVNPDTAAFETEAFRTPQRGSVVDGKRISSRGSPPFDVHSSSAFGTEYSRDLEDRIAKLEANLNLFQRSLQRLQTSKSRRDGVVVPTGQQFGRRDSAEFRSPSMLAEDLQESLAPSQYRYGFEPNERPKTAPSKPHRPPRPDEGAPSVPVPSRLARNEQPPPVLEPPSRPSRLDDPTTPTQASTNMTFSSLYQMLNEERSARRQLETRVHEMRTEITDLRYQVSAQSQIQSQRSSYLFPAASEMTAGSSRLRDLLGGAGSPSPRRSTSPPALNLTSKVVSRFSASTKHDSEAEATQAGSEEQQEQEAAYERTPRPERNRHLRDMDEETESLDSAPLFMKDAKSPGKGFPLLPTYRPDGGMF